MPFELFHDNVLQDVYLVPYLSNGHMIVGIPKGGTSHTTPIIYAFKNIAAPLGDFFLTSFVQQGGAVEAALFANDYIAGSIATDTLFSVPYRTVAEGSAVPVPN